MKKKRLEKVSANRKLKVLGGRKCLFSVLCLIVLLSIPLSGFAEDERNKSTFEVHYSAATFDDVQHSGSYGISYTLLPWKLVSNFYVGMHLSPFNFNFGLVDKDLASDVIKLGPALGYYFTPKIFVAMPIVAMCEVYFKGSNTKTAWGMSWAPTFYVGSKRIGLFAGPMFSVGFEGDSKVNCGFRAGFYF